jgi:3-deoxy-D-manno-octulosonic-acid transferase
MNNQSIKNSQVFIVDTIGLLSKIYSYADIAYVGGAMGTTGLHNILEPAVFGVPIIIGKNYDKFPEAKLMIKNGGVLTVNNFKTLENKLDRLTTLTEERLQIGKINKDFIKKNKGAVNQIMDYIRI